MTKHLLYFVDLDDQKNALLALEVNIKQNDQSDSIEFFDTNRGRGFDGNLIEMNENRVVFENENGKVMTFRVATVTEYDSCWRSAIEGSVPQFNSDSELHQWYYRQFLI